MSDSRSRFEQWYMETFKCASHLERISSLHMRDDEYIVLSTHHIWMAWQAAERETARRCHEIVHDIAVELVAQEGIIKRDVYVYEQGIGAERCEQAIQAEFPGAWE